MRSFDIGRTVRVAEIMGLWVHETTYICTREEFGDDG